MKTQTKSQEATKSKGFSLKKIVLCTLLAFASPYSFAAVTDVHCESGDDLHVAIANAASDDTLNITGTCFANDNTFIINKNLSLVGKDSSAILDGRRSDLTGGVSVVWIKPGAAVILDKLTIQKGIASIITTLSAGGITNEGNLIVKRSSIINNLDPIGWGAGIVQQGDNFMLQQSLVKSNYSVLNLAAALYQARGNTLISQSTFTDNITMYLSPTPGTGRVIFIFKGTMQVDSSTLAYNNAQNPSGQLFFLASSGSLDIKQSILSHNGSDIFALDPQTVTMNNSFTANTVDLLPLADNGGATMTMKPDPNQVGGNPAIGAVSVADCAVVATVDQRGAQRPGFGKTNCDAGAYETGDPAIAINLGFLNFGTIQNGSSLSLLVSIQNTGNDDLVLAQPVISPLSSNFSLVASAVTYPVSVKALNYFQDINVLYKPTANQTDNGLLTISYSNQSQSFNNSYTMGLTGTGDGFIVPPIQQIQDLLAILNNPLQNNLFGVGKGNSAANKYNAFVNMIKSSGSLITKGKIADACENLHDAAKKIDGKNNPPDFVAGTGAPAVYQSILNLMTSLNCSIYHDHDDHDDHEHDNKH